MNTMFSIKKLNCKEVTGWPSAKQFRKDKSKQRVDLEPANAAPQALATSLTF